MLNGHQFDIDASNDEISNNVHELVKHLRVILNRLIYCIHQNSEKGFSICDLILALVQQLYDHLVRAESQLDQYPRCFHATEAPMIVLFCLRNYSQAEVTNASLSQDLHTLLFFEVLSHLFTHIGDNSKRSQAVLQSSLLKSLD